MSYEWYCDTFRHCVGYGVEVITSAADQTVWSGSTATRLAELFCLTATSQVVVPYLLPISSTESEGWMTLLTAS